MATKIDVVEVEILRSGRHIHVQKSKHPRDEMKNKTKQKQTTTTTIATTTKNSSYSNLIFMYWNILWMWEKKTFLGNFLLLYIVFIDFIFFYLFLAQDMDWLVIGCSAGAGVIVIIIIVVSCVFYRRGWVYYFSRMLFPVYSSL